MSFRLEVNQKIFFFQNSVELFNHLLRDKLTQFKYIELNKNTFYCCYLDNYDERDLVWVRSIANVCAEDDAKLILESVFHGIESTPQVFDVKGMIANVIYDIDHYHLPEDQRGKSKILHFHDSVNLLNKKTGFQVCCANIFAAFEQLKAQHDTPFTLPSEGLHLGSNLFLLYYAANTKCIPSLDFYQPLVNTINSGTMSIDVANAIMEDSFSQAYEGVNSTIYHPIFCNLSELIDQLNYIFDDSFTFTAMAF